MVALTLMAAGLILVFASVGSFLLGYAMPLNVTIFAAVGFVFLVAGLLLLMTDVLETWVSRGQTALVDGLQAG
jgi:hypothetical protein